MDTVYKAAKKDEQNHLILTQHEACFTVGRDAWEKKWAVPTIKTDRGGSITCHSPGQNIYYFCFQTPFPARFFSNIRTIFTHLFESFDKSIHYNRQNPGFYIQNRKLCSLGFRYKNGISLHGVALNIDVDLAYHNQTNPCALEGIKATSLTAEDIHVNCEYVNKFVISETCRVFDESL